MQNFILSQINITNIMAISVDGKIASHSFESTSERNQIGMLCTADFQRLKEAVAFNDCVFISSKSIEVEKGAFRVHKSSKNRKEPDWIVFTLSGICNFSHPFWSQAGIPKALFHVLDFNINALPALSINEIILNNEKITLYKGNIPGLLEYLVKNKKTKYALLGGGKLNASFWEQNLVNHLFLTLSPMLFGKLDLPSLVSSSHLLLKKLKCESIAQSGDFIFIDYKVL
ncbi:dihydrofolate reductase family protein [Pigmentibacter sp. JX0631]|uniref:dihydrofolate reductase family protein n=1 Tax=Pigmentibacter sp. JX0631 TaxID=2976982 RepID=UPI0024691820|nr:dihydrofolate reductase family protein [Pigmentibacter sp. JX0631]WGL58957.1 dihydrofolate reductase family protein [Pigmentibacter sp. JX0631]